MKQSKATTSKENLKLIIMEKMALKNNTVLEEDIPNSWEKYGDLVLFRDKFFKSPMWHESDDAWKTICEYLNVKRIGLKGPVVDDDVRSPRVKIIFGNSGWVEMKDNGVIYSWDCERTMFCRGNLSERHRIGLLDCKGEVVVDLFAGIGYFTLPYLVHAGADHVHACEWNPNAVAALKRNLELNSVADRCTIHEGDNRKAGLYDIGDRINVGIIPSSQGFWKTACSALKKSGGILYIHENVTSGLKNKRNTDCSKCVILMQEENLKSDLSSVYSLKGDINTWELCFEESKPIGWKVTEWFEFSIHLTHLIFSNLLEVHPSICWNVSVQEYFRVKPYAPRIDHIVYAVYCYPVL